jgi:hypothetical protein
MGRVSSRRKARDPAFELLERGHFFFDDPTMVWRRHNTRHLFAGIKARVQIPA